MRVVRSPAAMHGSVGPGEGCCLSLLSLYNWYQLVLRYKLYCGTAVLHHGTWYGTYGTVGMVQARPSYVPYCGRYRSSKNMSQRYVE